MPRIEISKKIVIINSASSVLILVLNLSVLLWLQQYLLKRISPEEYSLIPIIMSIMAFSPLLTMVLTGGLGRYITVAYAKGDDEEIERICSTMFPILIVAAILFLTLGWLFAWQLDQFLVISPEYVLKAKIMMALLIFSAAVRIPLAVFGTGFLVRQKLYLEDFINIGCQLVRITILFSLLFGVSVSVLWVTLAHVISELLSLAITTPISRRLLPAQRINWGKRERSIAKEITGYSIWNFLNSVAETFKQAMDPLILNRAATAVDVSVFYVAGIAPRQLKLMLNPLSRPFIPIVAALHATGDKVKLRNTYTRIARYHAWLIISIAVPAIIFSYEVMHLYLDGKYDDAAKIMSVLLLVTILGTLNALGSAIAAASGELKGLALRMISVYSFNFVLTTVLVVYFEQGAFGAALGSLISVLLLETTLTWTYCRKIAFTPFKLWINEVVLPSLLPAIPSILFCLYIKAIVEIDSWSILLLVSFFSLVLNIIFISLFGLRQQDRIDIDKLLTRFLPTKKVK